MALDTFANLKTAIATLLNRDDLTSAVPDFITLAEADLNRKVRHWRMETLDAAFTVDSRFEDLPTDWLETVDFGLATSPPQELELLSVATMKEYRYSDSAVGQPRFYAHRAGDFEFYPTPDDTYTGELLYLARIPALSDSQTTNWLLTYHPDAYLYGAAVHSAPYLKDDERLVMWGELYKNAVIAINDEGLSAKASGTGLRIRTRAA
jgi:hypothetical protein